MPSDAFNELLCPHCCHVCQTFMLYQIQTQLLFLCSDAYENNRHLQRAVSDMYTKPPSNFSLLLKCVLSDMGTGECPVSFHTRTVQNYTICDINSW